MIQLLPESCRRLVKRFPATTLLLCGILVCIAPVGLLINLKSLDPQINDRFYRTFRIAGTVASGLAITCNIIGILLITRAAQLMVRRLLSNRRLSGKSSTETADKKPAAEAK